MRLGNTGLRVLKELTIVSLFLLPSVGHSEKYYVFDMLGARLATQTHEACLENVKQKNYQGKCDYVVDSVDLVTPAEMERIKKSILEEAKVNCAEQIRVNQLNSQDVKDKTQDEKMVFNERKILEVQSLFNQQKAELDELKKQIAILNAKSAASAFVESLRKTNIPK